MFAQKHKSSSIAFLSAGLSSRAFVVLYQALFALLLWAIVTARFVVADKVVPYDSKSQFYNFFRFVANSLSKGEYPLWNPYSYSGFPSVADPQSFVFNPFFLLFAKLMPDASMQAFDAFVLLHLAVGAFFVQLLARKLDLSIAASMITALVFFFGGSAMSRLQHVGLILSYAALPLCFLLLTLTLEKRSYFYGFMFAVFASLMALGRDQVAMLNCLVLIGFLITFSFKDGKPFQFIYENAKLISFISLIGFLILFYPVLLTLQFAALSNRPAIELKDAMTGSLDIANLLTIIFADFFGSLRDYSNYWGSGSSSWWFSSATDSGVNYLYVGVFPAICLFYAFVSKEIWFKNILFFTILSVVSLFYALGRFTPFYGLLFEAIPLFKLYRRPADATFLLIFSFSILAGVGFDAINRHNAISKFKIKIIFFIIGALTLLSIIQIGAISRLYIPLLSLIMAVFIGGISLYVISQKYKYAAMLLIVIALADFSFHSSLLPINSDERRNYAVFNHELSPDKTTIDIISKAMAVEHLKGNRPRVEILGPENGWQNAGMAYGLENTLGYNPLRLHGYEAATGASETAHEPLMRPFPKSFRGYRSKLARLLGIEFLVFDTPLTRMPSSMLRSRITVLQEGPPYWVYKLPPSLPRVMLAHSTMAVDISAIMKSGELPDFDLNNVVLVSELDKIRLETDKNSGGQAEITQYKQNSVKLISESDQPSLLVLDDIDYPGWEVFVDGEKRKIIRANILFRGVELTSGRHNVEFRFNPFGLENVKNAIKTLVKR